MSKKLYEEDDIQDIADAIREVKGTSVQYKVREMASALLKTSTYQLSEVYGNTKQSELPDGYTQLEYIKGTGTQYIDTGYSNKNDTSNKYVIDFSFTNVGGPVGTLFGGMDSTPITSVDYTNRTGIIVSRTEGRTYYAFGSTGSTQSPYNYVTDINLNKVIIDVNHTDNSYVITRNNVTSSSYSISGSAKSISNMYIFAVPYPNNTVGEFAQAKVYVCKIYANNILVRNFIPAKRNSDEEIGMYDLVTETFFTNKGTDKFVAGPNSTPSETNPIEIKSVGDKHNNKFFGIMGNHKYRNYNSGLIVTGSAYEGTDYIKVKPNTKYTLAGKILDTSITATKYWTAFTFYDQDFGYINYTSNYLSDNNYSKTATTPSNAYYMSICFWASGIDFTYFQNTMLNKGDALTYEPYKDGDYAVEVYINEPSGNLYDKTQALCKNCYIDSDGLPVRNTNWNATDFIKVKGKEFTLTRTKSTGNAPCIAGYDKNLNLLVSQAYNGNSTISISSDTKIEYIRFSLINTTSEKEEGTDIMLNAGLNAKSYKEYKKPISVIIDEPLRKRGNVSDILTPSGLVRKLSQTDYTGTKSIEESIEVLETPVTETVEWSEQPIGTSNFTPTFMTEIQPSDYTVEEVVDTNFLAGYDQAILDMLEEG